MGLRDKIAGSIPWIEPIREYFDWRKRAVAIAVAIAMAAWSYLKDLSWPVIAVLALASLVSMAYALVFPAFLKLIHVGVRPRPNHSIWKHKSDFALMQAAFLLAEREPTWQLAVLDGDAAAWYEVLCEAIQKKQLAYVPSPTDSQHTDALGRFSPQTYTLIPAADLKKFCEAKGAVTLNF